MVQANTRSIRLRVCKAQWPYSQSLVSKVLLEESEFCCLLLIEYHNGQCSAGVLRESVVHGCAQVCTSGNGRPGK